MPTFIVAADLHLRNRTWSRLPLYGDAYEALTEISGLALGHAGLILAGDLFVTAHHPDMPASLQHLITATKGISNIIYTVGNHDKTGSPGGLSNPEWVESVMDHKIEYATPQGTMSIGSTWHYREDEIHEVAGVRFATLHHTSSHDELVNKLLRISMSQFDVLVMHQGFVETISIEGQYETTAHEVATLLGPNHPCKCVITGHIHKPMTFRSGATAERPQGLLFISPGSTYKCTLDKNEPDCGYGVLTVDGGGTDQPVYGWTKLNNQRQREFLPPLPADPSQLQQYIDFISGVARNAQASSLPESIKMPLVSFDYVVMPGVVSGISQAAANVVCVDALPITASVHRKKAAQSADVPTSVDFAVVASKYASGPALDVIMAVQRGEEPEIALSAALDRIVGKAV